MHLIERNVVKPNFLEALGQEARETQEPGEVSGLSPTPSEPLRSVTSHITETISPYQDLKMVCSSTPSVSQRPSRVTLAHIGGTTKDPEDPGKGDPCRSQ
jgi:hypothetical protein